MGFNIAQAVQNSTRVVVGTIMTASDFPTPQAVVTSGAQYQVLASVTDNDSTRTNTGQSFASGDYIVWTGTAWNNISGTNTAGTVTSVSVATANGFSGTVTNPTTTPQITIEINNAGTVRTALGLATTDSPLFNGLTLTIPLSAANGGTGLSSLGTNVSTFLGTPSSANLAAAITDETGSGALVFATSPTLVTPNIGAATATSLAFGSNLSLNSSGRIQIISANNGSGTNYLSFEDSGSEKMDIFYTTFNSLNRNIILILADLMIGTNWSATPILTIKDSDVAIGINNTSPALSAIFDITSTAKGFLTPRMTTTQKNNIASPATGLELFDTSLAIKSIYTGSDWQGVLAGNAGATAPSTSAGTGIINYYGSSAANFLGTPNTWFSVKASDGNTYKIPGYS